MYYYLSKNNIFQVQKIGEFFQEKFIEKGKPKVKIKFIKFEVIKQLGAERPQNSAFHLPEKDFPKKVFLNLEEPKKIIIGRLKDKILKINNL